MSDKMIGKIISHYHILEKLGEGRNPAYPGSRRPQVKKEKHE
jgi:hypothetical protein